ALAWLYVETASIPAVEPFLVGIPAAVLAIIAGALWRLGKKAITSLPLALIAAAVAAALLLGVREIPALFLGGGLGGLALYLARRPRGGGSVDLKEASLPVLLAAGLQAAAGAVPSLAVLGLFFLKVGAVLYGSGYVLVAFLEADVVDRYGWLTQTQLLDAIALGQLTPGPVLTTSTAVGYMVQGVPGAAVATLGIFLPAFLFTGLLHPLVPKLRSHPLTAALLDAVNAASVALMAVVTVMLAVGTLTSVGQWIVALVAVGLVFSGKVNVIALVAFGAVAGWLLSLLGG
ncbi:MAG: chromate efflux transporter, partial [Bacteroidota bacterium]